MTTRDTDDNSTENEEETSSSPRASVLFAALGHVGCAGVRTILRKDPEVSLVGETARADKVIAKAIELEPEHILVGTEEIAPEFFDLLRRLREARPQSTLIVLTDRTDHDSQTKLRRIPVTGILAFKDVESATLHECLDLAAKDIRFGSGKGADAVFGSEASEFILSSGEGAVLRGLEDDLPTAEIAEREHMHLRTAQRHKRSLLHKAGVESEFALGRKLAGAVVSVQAPERRRT